MAEGAVGYLVEKLGTLLDNEVRLLGGIRDEIEDVRLELELMKAFLREAEAMKEVDKGLKAWVKQVRELAYDAEDVIDEFLLRFEYPKKQGLSGRFSKIARVLMTLKARRRVAFELKKIKYRVIAVQGKEGLGKTTLVNELYGVVRVKKRFQLRAWVAVSQSFGEREVLLNIIKQLFQSMEQSIPGETYTKDIQSLKQDIQSFLRKTKYLIVLDDVRTTRTWESIKSAFPDNNFGSLLIVTTRVNDVSEMVTSDVFEGSIYRLKSLDFEESVSLFSTKGFSPYSLDEDFRFIVRRCQGSPLAIVLVSGLLASKSASKEEWQRVRRSLESELHNDDLLMEKILSLCFNDLPYHLQSCLMYLSMFPEGWLHKKQNVIKLWIAEGFVQQMENATAEDMGDLYFSELIARSLIRVTPENDMGEDHSPFQVHDILRKFLLRKSLAQSFGTSISEHSLLVPERARRLFVDASLEKLEADCNCSRLRLLLCISSSSGMQLYSYQF